ncbi:hypothetical protein [Solihabitans fulvus]|uniref:hypothetical protein n=1 Tax=Solihabitans fulvus TaxID=1892852 RepID=UPI001CB7606E|nr:hypothetical protein [Solihabitans fulvus]
MIRETAGSAGAVAARRRPRRVVPRTGGVLDGGFGIGGMACSRVCGSAPSALCGRAVLR